MKRLFYVAVGLSLSVSASGFSPAQGTERETTITVSAAASLTDVLPVIAKAFNKRNPNITITFNFAGSNALVEQLRAGAPVDLIATASAQSMRTAIYGGWVVPNPLPFASNTLAIATPRGNPAEIRTLKDLESPRVLTAVCARTVPCGQATQQLFTRNKVNILPVTRELDVRAVLGKVISDQVDAGLVYSSDARTAQKSIHTIAIPLSQNVKTTYFMATVSDSEKQKVAKRFLDYVKYSSISQSILRSFGFGTS